MAFSFTPQPQQQPSLFQPQQKQSPFQLSGGSPFFQSQQQQQQLQQQQQQQLQQQQPQQQSQFFLFTNEKTPASYGTKWADLHPDSQKFLLQIEERILEYRDESQRLDQCGRLYDSSVSNEGFSLDASHILQELGGISTSMDRQKVLLQELTANVKDMLRNTEIAVRSFLMLRSKFLHPNKTSTVTTSQPSGAIITITTQPTTSAMVPVYDFYSGMPRKPSLFLQQTVARFDKYLGECCKLIEELEQLLFLESNKNAVNSNTTLLQSLPKVMSNVHDFFVYVAAKVESIHQYMESMKTAYLVDQRGRGDGNNPFLEADRRETAKRVAAERRVHPTLHLPSISQPSAQSSGSGSLLTSSATPVASAAPPASTGASGLFSSPFSAASSSLFSTPAAASAPSFSFIASSGASPQTSIFGPSSSSTPSLFSTPAAGASPFSTPFATNPSTGASAFSTPFAATTPSTFSTPFGTGAATGSGQSFNTISKGRAKSRTGKK